MSWPPVSMAEKRVSGSEGGQSLGEFTLEKSSWAQIVWGPAREARWMAHKVSPGEVEELRQYFTKVLTFP